MRERMADALRACDTQYAEIRIEEAVSTVAAFRGDRLERVEASKGRGGMVRALHAGGWGVATFNDLEGLGGRVRDACAAARLVNGAGSYFAACAPLVAEYRAALEVDFRDVPLPEKIARAEAYNRVLLEGHPEIITTYTGYSDAFRRVWYANTEGAFTCDERPDVGVYLSATARRGDNVQQATEARFSTESYAATERLEGLAEEAAKRAGALLDAPPVTGGTYTVIADPRLTGVFAHEAFGHLSEADHLYESERLKEVMTLGRRFGPEILNIVDDGSLPGLRGSLRWDDEGVAARRNDLIREGVLAGRLHSRETAAYMGERPSGNARAVGYHYAPIVRMTNTFIEAGATSFEDMIKDIKLGLYACDMRGGQTAMEMFTFSAAYAYMIRDGAVAELVRDVVLTGNVFDTLERIEAVGDTLVFPPGGGGCGKGGQSGLPVGLGGPHLRIGGVVVGGEAV